jgi:molybdate transport system substrate-binding protein
LVLGENIAQTLQFAQTGAADAGIVALSLVMAPRVKGEGRYWEVPQSLYPPIEQGGVVLHDSAAAREFRDAMLSTSGRRTMARYGFAAEAAP